MHETLRHAGELWRFLQSADASVRSLQAPHEQRCAWNTAVYIARILEMKDGGGGSFAYFSLPLVSIC